MSRPWRKGCLCGCLYQAECAYYEPPAQVVHHVHHVIHVVPPAEPAEPELAWPVVQGEVIS